jgi:Family of unknown function (DUF5994)
MAPDSSDPTTAIPPIEPADPPGPRLRLDPTLCREGVVDGGWWPRSRNPAAELSELIAGLASSLGPISRVALNPDAWDQAPDRVAVDGRRVRVGWFRTMDPHLIGVTPAFQGRLALLVVPPRATTAAAAIAMAMAADATNSAGPADILAAGGIGAENSGPTPPRRVPQEPSMPLLDGEGGRPAAMSGATPQQA